MPVLTFGPQPIVWLWLFALMPALTFDLILILDIDVERRARILGFEVGYHRRLHTHAKSRWEIAGDVGNI